jgi:hypothetical protein
VRGAVELHSLDVVFEVIALTIDICAARMASRMLYLFFTESGAPIVHLGYCYWRWQRTLKRLAIRYRKPYVARHTSVSWNLMIGRNPLLVAKEHGHRLTTMLTVYAGWPEDAVEADILAIRESMNRTARGKPHLSRQHGPRRLNHCSLQPAARSAAAGGRTSVRRRPIRPRRSIWQ